MVLYLFPSQLHQHHILQTIEPEVTMEKSRHGSCSYIGLLLPLMFLFLLDMSMADVQPARLSKAQESTMRNLSSIVSDMAPWTSWNTSDSNPCLWSGVTCSVPSSQRSGSSAVVLHLSLSGFGLSTSTVLASSICYLDTLQSLDLSKNRFTGFPRQLASCPLGARLRDLNLSNAQVPGPLDDFSGFSELEVLDFSFSYLSGNVHKQLSSLPRLRILNLSYNRLDGVLPTNMAHSLKELVLSNNQFSGQIPAGLFGLKNLTLLDLTQNNLEGDVPDEFFKLSNLQTLLLTGNHLCGMIPGSLSGMATLAHFADKNNFSGSIPSGITKNLKVLDLSYNMLSGEIPSDLFLAPGLHTVDFTSNMLEGRIPGGFSRSLYSLRLGGNFLNGSIPSSIGDASSLSYLELENNYLVGGIPSQVGKCSKLVILNLARNELNGALPTEIGKLNSLVVLKLEINNLDGHIPSELSDLVSLSELDLSQNSFSGEIPREIVQLPLLSNMNLQGNKITGAIPASISSLQYLIELNLGNNELTGSIPTMPTSLSTILNLSHNHLSGSIPSDIGSLPDLEILDVSYNDLSGQIPSSLTVMPSLTQLVLSFNQLSGYLPTFYKVAVNSTGNPDLSITDPEMTIGGEDNELAIWIAAFSFVVSFFISFYVDGIRNRWSTG